MLLVNFKRKIALLLSMALMLGLLSGCAVTVERPSDKDVNLERHIENLNEISNTGLHNLNEPQEITESNYQDENDSFTEYDTAEIADVSIGEDSETETDDVAEENKNSQADTVDYQDLRIYTDEEIAQSGASNVGRFAYERLSPDEKKIYNEIFMALSELSAGAYLDCLDSELVNKIFVCVMTDHPEIFWTTGYVCSRYTRGDELEAIGFRGDYSKTKETIEQNKQLIDAYVNNCLSGLPAGDDYSKIKYIYEYIILNTDYDLSAPDNQNICSVFINGKSVCQGYAKATQYLLNKAGVMCTLVSGVVSNNESHSWNLVSADGSYYYVDTTWGDASYITNEPTTFVPPVSYDYLCVTTTDLLRTHTPQPIVDLPLCGSYKDNYYVREGAYFMSVDTNQLADLFGRYKNAGREYVTIKCNDMNVYSSMEDYLINSQHIFDYIDTDGTVSFWKTEDEASISFKL